MTSGERLALWLRLTSLPPPECRGFVSRDEREPEPRLAVRELHRLRKRDQARWERERQKPEPPEPDKVRGFMPKGSLPDPSWRNNGNPWQENAIRAWEDAA
jgi:hypothetical protein